jgi:cytochrome c peroxidase
LITVMIIIIIRINILPRAGIACFHNPYQAFIHMNYKYLLLTLLGLSAVTGYLQANEEAVPAEEMLGERLFLETRFAQSYMKNPGQADPVLDHTETLSGNRPGPFKGTHMSCRSCHMVDEHKDTAMAGMRTYADFARRSPVPSREDGQASAVRNSQSLVGISQKDNAVFHHDGEFPTLRDLVRATFTGRNMGWLTGEEKQAVQHIANIIRRDDGKGELAQEFGGAYTTVLKGKVGDAVLPEQYRIDVSTATDQEILDAVAELVTAYVSSLDFTRDAQGHYSGSAYDAFLAKNKLPRGPQQGETDKDYAKRLHQAVQSLKTVEYVGDKDGKLALHDQAFQFAQQELKGMRIFFGKGNCTACHTPPSFSDFGFHNTGISQAEYDALHGQGSFMKLAIPGADKKPGVDSRYRNVATKDKPGYTDLGVWNIVGNIAIASGHRETLRKHLCSSTCDSKEALNKAIAAFKTPPLRDLGHNAPYMHSGSKDNLEEVLAHYLQISKMARSGKLRNSSSDIEAISLTASDLEPLAAFLRALNEDYE